MEDIIAIIAGLAMLGGIVWLIGQGCEQVGERVVEHHSAPTADTTDWRSKSTHTQRKEAVQRMLAARAKREEDPWEFTEAKHIFEDMTGLTDGDPVPDWLHYQQAGNKRTRREWHDRNTDGMPATKTAKARLMKVSDGYCQLTGNPLGDAVDCDHKIDITECQSIYTDGTFRMVRPDGGDWHAWDNLQLVDREAHKRKNRASGHYGAYA